MPNIYTVKFNQKGLVTENLEKMKKALDTKVAFIHSENEATEQSIQEFYLLNNNNANQAIKIDEYMVNLNKNARSERVNQAKEIIIEFAKVAGKEKEAKERLLNVETLDGDGFTALLDEFGPVYYKYEHNDILLDSADIETKIDKETYERNKATIEFNKEYEPEEHKELTEKAYESAIKALGFEKSDIDNFYNAVNNSGTDKNAVSREFNKIIKKEIEKIPSESRNEEDIYDISNRFFKTFDMYLKGKMDASVSLSIKEHVSSNEFKDYALGLTSPVEVASIIRNNAEERLKNYSKINANAKDELDLMLKNIKHLEEVHSKRSLFTRFVDWFRKDGENSTINDLKNQLIKKGHTKEEIEEALENADSKIDTRFDHTPTIDTLVESVNSETNSELGAYGYIQVYANRNLENIRNERNNEIVRKNVEISEASNENEEERDFENDMISLDESLDYETENVNEMEDSL